MICDYFKQQCEEHESVIYFALSSAASGQYQTSKNLVKSEIEERKSECGFSHCRFARSFSVHCTNRRSCGANVGRQKR